jgi:CspA family cold shock protein
VSKRDDSVIKVGVVKWFNDDKGYGFITGADGVEIFVHYTGIRGLGHKSLNMGDEVEYIVGQNARGPCANDVNVTKSARMV